MMDKFDVVVIGGGPGGYTAAIRCAQLGKKTALAEREHLGGVCLNWGCIPTKSLLENAHMAANLKRNADYGITLDAGSVKIDYNAAYQRSRKVSEQLAKGVAYLMKKNNITVFNDSARIVDAKTVEMTASGKKINTENIILATGSSPAAILGLDFSDPDILNSKKALQLTSIPKTAVIIGAGAIGAEFAAIWNAFGADVTLVEMQDRILPLEDADVSAYITKCFNADGVKTVTSAKVEAVNKTKSGVEITIDGKNGKTKITCEKLLISAGTRPNTDGIGLESLKLSAERGFIPVDDNMRTAVKGVYAIGDITGKLALAHTASAQGIIAAETIAGLDTRPITYKNIPRCTYCMPETASAGLTEAEAREAGYEIKTAVFPFSANGRALAAGRPGGFVKILADSKTGEILGAHMAGDHVSELIPQVALMIGLEVTDEELTKIIYPHPSLSEALVEAAHMLTGNPINL